MEFAYLSAANIAQQHITKTNPSLWSGNGPKPDSFDSRIATYRIGENCDMDISFEHEEDGWMHCCELRDHSSGELLAIQHGAEINSVAHLASTIQGIV